MRKGDVGEENDECRGALYLPGLAGEVEGEGVLGAGVWERVREGEKGKPVLKECHNNPKGPTLESFVYVVIQFVFRLFRVIVFFRDLTLLVFALFH